MLSLVLLIAGFVTLSGALATVDAAFLSVTLAEAEEMAARRVRGAGMLRLLLRRQMRAVIVLVILTNTVNILGPVLIGVRASVLLGNQILGVLTAFLTGVTIVFSEIIPKAIGTRHAPGIARGSAPFLAAILFPLSPVVSLLELAIRPFRRGERPAGTEAQIRALATIGETEGHIDEEERSVIHRIFGLNDRTAAAIMLPRSRVDALPAQATVREAASIAAAALHHRYPVFGDDVNDVRGFVMSRDILQALAEGRSDAPIRDLLHPPLIVEHGTRVDDLLDLFRSSHIHLAMVRGADGSIVGIVTLHDVLEELVGELRGEEAAGR